MKTIIILIFSTLSIFSCAPNEKYAKEQNFDAEILSQAGDTSDPYYKDLQVWSAWLNLSEINSDSDIELRLWSSPELLIKKQMLQFRKLAGRWEASLYLFDIRSRKLDSLKKIIPKSSWEIVEKGFANRNIGRLPDDRNVPVTLLYEDGISFLAEIADKKSYRYSKFSNPQQIAQQNKEASHWYAVLGFISQEFEISY